jgi:hypothetical protein
LQDLPAAIRNSEMGSAWCFEQTGFDEIRPRPSDAVIENGLRPAGQPLLTVVSSQFELRRQCFHGGSK